MPTRLVRYQQSGQTHFVTFSCYHRRPLLRSPAAARTFELALERVRRDYRLRVYAYVVMPDHVHLLLSEPERSVLAEAIKALKQGVSRKLRMPDGRFWQTRYYDLNVHDERKRIEQLQYLHRNPVKASLCAKPEDWAWSSFRHYSDGTDLAVEIESERTARRRDNSIQVR